MRKQLVIADLLKSGHTRRPFCRIVANKIIGIARQGLPGRDPGAGIGMDKTDLKGMALIAAGWPAGLALIFELEIGRLQKVIGKAGCFGKQPTLGYLGTVEYRGRPLPFILNKTPGRAAKRLLAGIEGMKKQEEDRSLFRRNMKPISLLYFMPWATFITAAAGSKAS